MGAYVLFVWAIVATGLLIRLDYKTFTMIGTLNAALSFASNLPDNEARMFLRIFLSGSEESLTRRFPAWPAYRDHALGIGDDGR